MAEDLREIARGFQEGALIPIGELQHAVMTSQPGHPLTAGGFLPGPSRIVSAQRRPSGSWDVEFVRLVEAAGAFPVSAASFAEEGDHGPRGR